MSHKTSYTKEELFKMGLTFDTNGNLISPKEESEHLKKYLKYRDKKKLDQIIAWFDKNVTSINDSGVNLGFSSYEEVIEDIKKLFIKELQD